MIFNMARTRYMPYAWADLSYNWMGIGPICNNTIDWTTRTLWVDLIR